jgi:phage baseplate assembly protein W
MTQKFIGITLPIRLGNTGMFEQSIDTITQTRSNFRNLILTKKGERLVQTTFGCDIWRILFEPMTEDTLESARFSVEQAVDDWLPFIELIDFDISSDENRAKISIRCLYRFRNNPNVTDEVVVNMAGTPNGPPVPYGLEGDLFEKKKTVREYRKTSREVRR